MRAKTVNNFCIYLFSKLWNISGELLFSENEESLCILLKACYQSLCKLQGDKTYEWLECGESNCIYMKRCTFKAIYFQRIDLGQIWMQRMRFMSAFLLAWKKHMIEWLEKCCGRLLEKKGIHFTYVWAIWRHVLSGNY